MFDRLAAQPFLYKCGLLIVGLSILRGVLGPDLASLGFIILPCAWLLGIMIRAMLNEQGAMDGLGENLDFLWERTEPSDRRRQCLLPPIARRIGRPRRRPRFREDRAMT